MAIAARSARVLAPGTRIGEKLHVLRHLSDGGMGSTWAAENLATGASVAIKVLHAKSRADVQLDAIERFRHEAIIGATLEHRNITKVFDLIEDGGNASLVLVMELLQGETLEQRLKRGVLTGPEAVGIVGPILLGMHHAHQHGIIHRDLKPSNVFLHVDPDGHVIPKLLDFGVAKMKQSSITTFAGNVLGTPAYMSPEQVRVSPQLDGRSDLFAAATVLYEALTGENPFATDAPSATLARVLELEVDPDPRIEPALWREIARALSKQPYERHESAAAFARALRVAVGEPDGPPLESERRLVVPRQAPPAVPPPAPPVVAEVAVGARPSKRVMLFALAVLALGALLVVLALRHVPAARPVVPPTVATVLAPAAPPAPPPSAVVSAVPPAPPPPAMPAERRKSAPRAPAPGSSVARTAGF